MENLLSPGPGHPLMSPAELQEGIASLSRGTYFREASLEMMLSRLLTCIRLGRKWVRWTV